MDVTYTENFPDAADFLRTTVISALEVLSGEFQETPLEAAEHLQAIIVGVVTGKAEFASLYDEAVVTPKLMEHLVSLDAHTVVAQRWGTTEQAVRRTREKIARSGMMKGSPRFP